LPQSILGRLLVCMKAWMHLSSVLFRCSVTPFNWGVSWVVTARTATPTKVDSELSDVHLESLKRREGEEKCH